MGSDLAADESQGRSLGLWDGTSALHSIPLCHFVYHSCPFDHSLGKSEKELIALETGARVHVITGRVSHNYRSGITPFIQIFLFQDTAGKILNRLVPF